MLRTRSRSRPRPKDVVLAVMGPTGVGKSSFIKRITGFRDIKVSHSLQTGTNEVTAHKITLEAGGTSHYRAQTFNVTILDCPGFDDPSTPDQKTITSILEFLDSSQFRGKKLHGIIYMLDICNIRFRGVDRRNVVMFQQLCGTDFYSNVVLCTTHWDQLQDPREGIQREEELRSNRLFWGEFAAKGSKLQRVKTHEKGGNKDDVNIVLDIARKHHPRILRAQKEMNDGRPAFQTTAAREESVWNLYLTQERRQLQERLQQAKDSMQEQLRQNKEDLRRELEDVEAKIFREDENERQQLARKVRELEFRTKEYRDRLCGGAGPVVDGTSQYPPRTRDHERKTHEKRMEELAETQKRKLEELEIAELTLQEKKRVQVREVKRRCKRKHDPSLPVEIKCGGPKSGGCRAKINPKKEQYYHCCYCADDNYDHCMKCGPSCPKSSHPKMTLFNERAKR